MPESPKRGPLAEVSKHQNHRKRTALIRNLDGSTGITTIKSANRNVSRGKFRLLADGSYQPIGATAPLLPSNSKAKCDPYYAVFWEQVKDGAWKRLMGDRRITARQAKHVPFAGDIRKLGLQS